MLKLGCILPDLANICLHKSTDYRFYLLLSKDKDLFEKIWENMTRGPSIVFTWKAVANRTLSQLYPYLLCQNMPICLFTRWDYYEETHKFNARQNRLRSIENMVMSYFQATRPECKIESCYFTGRRNFFFCFSVDGYRNHC